MLFYGDQYYCPICESHLSRFVILQRKYHLWCPVCRSLQRHRLSWIFLNSAHFRLNQGAKRLLHIAPEPALAAKLSKISGLDYLSADLNDPKAMVKMDICDIQFPDNSFDVIYCSHVLEHIPDDQKAMQEFWRVITPDGQAIIIVPITASTTIEDPAMTDPIEREKRFGQYDHVRCYGPDIKGRLEKAGFEVTRFTTEDLVAPGEILRQGLTSRETIFLCRKQLANSLDKFASLK
jgi:SAM-dependent methyltransferase